MDYEEPDEPGPSGLFSTVSLDVKDLELDDFMQDANKHVEKARARAALKRFVQRLKYEESNSGSMTPAPTLPPATPTATPYTYGTPSKPAPAPVPDSGGYLVNASNLATPSAASPFAAEANPFEPASTEAANPFGSRTPAGGRESFRELWAFRDWTHRHFRLNHHQRYWIYVIQTGCAGSADTLHSTSSRFLNERPGAYSGGRGGAH